MQAREGRELSQGLGMGTWWRQDQALPLCFCVHQPLQKVTLLFSLPLSGVLDEFCHGYLRNLA